MNTKNSKKLISRRVFAAIIVISMLALSAAAASAATEDEIRQAIGNGTAYLASVQNGDGSWGPSDKVAVTGLVLLKLQEHAHELGLDPYDNDPLSPTYYVYADNVIAGMDYMLGEAVIAPTGIYFAPGHHEVYNTAIALCALGVSSDPAYTEIAQNVTNWLVDAQIDSGFCEGGWGYTANDDWCDNSNSGYAVLGLAYAENFDCTIPGGVRHKLNKWIGNIQCTVAGSDHGGSGYSSPCSWVNTLKTGNLLQQMCFYGDTYPDVQRVLDAKHYLERHWQDANQDPGWGYSLAHPDTQAMFTIMKGLTCFGIGKDTILIDTDGDGVQDDDWFNQEPSVGEDFASALVDTQNDDGSWSGCRWGGSELCTAWALLTLEKIVPLCLWQEINKELDDLIDDVNAATMPNIIKQRLLDKLEYAKALKENAHEECRAGNFDGATKKLGVAKSQVESFASMVRITRRISATDKEDFLDESAKIVEKIDRLIEHIETEHNCIC